MKKLDDKGNVTILICFAVVILFSLTAYVVDIGLVYIEKAKLTKAIDAAVLAAALELPENRENAILVAEEYIKKNDIAIENVIIDVKQDNKSIEILGNSTVEHFFAPVFGVNNSSVKSRTKAIIAPLKSIKSGLRPFAVEKFDFSYGDLVTLKQGAGDGYHGNYGAVALGGNGANNFKNNALYGYKGVIYIGDYIDTEPGNMSGATNAINNYIASENSTFDNFDRDSIRIWTIPLVDSLQVDGRKQVLVVGFAQFYVEDVRKKSGKSEIDGRFIRYVTNGQIDTTIEDTGCYGTKLVR